MHHPVISYWRRAYIGLGGNTGDRLSNSLKALEILSAHPEIKVARHSRFYETEPVGVDSEAWFLNAVAEIYTDLSPAHLVEHLLEVEEMLGRDRSRGDDRPIDLDLLFMEDIVTWALGDEDEIPRDLLSVPHPRLHDRGFVLVPWAELAPALVVQPWGKTVSEMLDALPGNKPAVRVYRETCEESGRLQDLHPDYLLQKPNKC
ncbi:MAG TPA: 2-amino-4-hydroxy-6-hydroxymethyldihydropteridine diphosphokinase [Thermodesulfobacteriaceae bacterium]|nr:2-amino-4-hydroxy-6-hydroxymethyldihydropteridine diphosphokinase [Thermodesulfobacteriaceae bacterium]